jgi:opacity protein-like surface antigen
MKLSLLAASVATLALGAGTASAQPVVLVPHRDHYHIVPAYPSYPSYGGGYGYRNYSPGLSFSFNYGSPRVYSPGYGGGYGGGYGSGYRYGGGYGSGYGGGYNHGGGHYHNGHYHR